MRLRAFTLVELIVVLIILAVVAGVALPRVTGNAERRSETEARAVHALLATVAEQHAFIGASTDGGEDPEDDLGAGPVPRALEYRVVDGRAEMRAVHAGASGVRRAGASPDTQWTPERLVEPVTLEQLRVARLVIDGQEIALGSSFGGAEGTQPWQIRFSPGSLAPSVSMLLTMESQPGSFSSTLAWQIDLAPESPVPTIRERNKGGGGGQSSTPLELLPPRAVDLDAAGAGDIPW